MVSIEFTDIERELMDKHRLAIFEDRLILDAQPPIDNETIHKIEQHLSGPIPEELLELWKVSFGGELDYNLHLIHEGEPVEISLDQLFYPQSNHYFDLWGWINFKIEWHREQAEEIGSKFVDKLDYLPFAGYDELIRCYLCVRPGEDYGKVVFWMMGDLWLHPERKGEVASNLREAFSRLSLDRKLAELGDLDDGDDYLYAFETLKNEGPQGALLANKLQKLVESTIPDWKAALDAGNLVGNLILEKIALEDIKRSDDAVFMQRLLDAGLDTTRTRELSSISIFMAYGKAWRVIGLLQRYGVSTNGVLSVGIGNIPLELVKDIVEDSHEITNEMIIDSIESENLNVANLLLEKFDSKARSLERKILFDKFTLRSRYYKKLAKKIDAEGSTDPKWTSAYARRLRDVLFRYARRYVQRIEQTKQ